VFFDPRGGTHFDGRWEAPGDSSAEEPEKDLAESLKEQNRRRGVRPDGWTAGARWKREVDIPDRVYFRALEALNEAGL